MLFIDARNYYTVVDRTLNEWSEWQLKNLQAIVHLYRGETEKYKVLVAEYRRTIAEEVEAIKEKKDEFSGLIDKDTRGHFEGLLGWIYNAGEDYSELRTRINNQIMQTKACSSAAENSIEKRKVKAMRQAGEAFCSDLKSILDILDEYEWIVSKFGADGEYQDVLGLCKIATIDEISKKSYSLTPGAYVGVAEVEDDGIDFHQRMNEIHAELSQLNAEANVLMSEIMKEWDNLNAK